MIYKHALERLTEEAQIEREEKCQKRLAAHVENMYKLKPKSRAEIKRQKLFELRRKNNEIRCELDINRELEQEAKRNEEARLALYRANMSPAQKRQQEEDTQRMATWASGSALKPRSHGGLMPKQRSTRRNYKGLPQLCVSDK
jgi:hypothetical protein